MNQGLVFDLSGVIYLFSALLSFLLAVRLITLPCSLTKSCWMIISYLFLTTLISLGLAVIHSSLIFNRWYLALTIYSLSIGLGVLAYLMAYFKMKPRLSFSSRVSIHILPLLFAAIICLSTGLCFLSLSVYGLTYLVNILLLQRRKHDQQSFINSLQSNKDLHTSIYLLLPLILSPVLYLLLEGFDTHNFYNGFLLIAGTPIFANFFLFTPQSISENTQNTIAKSEIKRDENSTKKLNLSEERKEAYLDKVLKLIEGEKIYLQNNLSLSYLAERTQVSPRYLSLIINEKKNQSFTDFINGYRVSEAKELLANPDYAKFSIAGIATEVGFSSRQTFYQAFRKLEGFTPGQFRKSCNDSGIHT